MIPNLFTVKVLIYINQDMVTYMDTKGHLWIHPGFQHEVAGHGKTLTSNNELPVG